MIINFGQLTVTMATDSVFVWKACGYIAILLAMCSLTYYQFGDMVYTSDEDSIWKPLLISPRSSHNKKNKDQHRDEMNETTGTSTESESNFTTSTTSNMANITSAILDENSTIATTAPDMCQMRRYEITDNCNISATQRDLIGDMANFEDLATVLFVDDIVTELIMGCPNGTWCLNPAADRLIYQRLGENYVTFCDLGVCLLELPDECLTEVSKQQKKRKKEKVYALYFMTSPK